MTSETETFLNASCLPFLRFVVPEPLSDWADEHRYIGDTGGPEPGRWRTSRTPYMKKILDCITDPTIDSIAICAGVQVGKTEALLTAIAYYMQHDPSTIMLVEPDETLVKDTGVDRVDAMIRESPELRKIFRLGEDLQKSKKRAQITAHMKRFPGGYLFLASSASPSALKSRPIRIVLCDEIDTYPMRPDGHPVDMAGGRSTTFIDKKKIMVSSPTSLQTSEIWRRVGVAEAQYEYRIPCPHCGEFHAWKWAMVKWDDEQGVRMECPTCHGKIRDGGAASDALLATGDWFLIRGKEDASSVSFVVPGLLSPWMPLIGMVKEFKEAHYNRDSDRLRTFIQERLAEPWDDNGHYFDLRTKADHEFEDEFDHTAIKCVTAGIDTQRDRVEITFVGWGVAFESWVLDHVIVKGSPLLDETWHSVTLELAKKHVLSDGRELPTFAVAVDSGGIAEKDEAGHMNSVTTKVYNFVAKLSKANVIAVKGASKQLAQRYSPPSRTAVKGAYVYVIDTARSKECIYDRLRIRTYGPGYIHIPSELSGEYWKQLNAEQLEEVTEKGVTKKRWVKTRPRNEALDCYVYALAAYEIFNAKLRTAKHNTRQRRVM